MNCPCCAQLIRIDSSHCQHCGFDVWAAEDAYGVETHRIDRIAECYQAGSGQGLGRLEKLMLNRSLDRLERQFPDLAFAACFFEWPEPLQLQSYGFWLLNHCLLADKDHVQANASGAILLVDQRSQSAGFVLGYRVEPFVDNRELVRCLEAGERYFHEGRYGAGANAAMKAFGSVLARGIRRGGGAPPPRQTPRPAEPDWKTYVRTPGPERLPVHRPVRDLEPNQI